MVTPDLVDVEAIRAAMVDIAQVNEVLHLQGDEVVAGEPGEVQPAINAAIRAPHQNHGCAGDGAARAAQ